jgi:N-ethylmaleimide reductase
MAPLTRMRAERESFSPRPLNAEYYGQRATKGGLLIAEASPVLSHGRGNPATPGIYSEAQIAGWRKVVDAVHAKGGIIFLQLWHVGRVSHSSYHGGELPVSASAIPIKAEGMKAMTADGKIADYETPRALETDEVKGVVEAFRQGAKNALAAGFDGVEIHGANGYLLEQFLQSRSNQRTDQYGGSIENRARLMLEVSKAVVSEAGADRTGIRISPVTPANDISDSNPQALYDHIVDGLSALKLVYLHVVEGATGGPRDIAPFDYAGLRKRFSGAYVANNGYDFDLATKVLDANAADLIAFGKPFISNPDLVERLKKGAALNDWDKNTFYGGGAKGYTDYPTLAAQAAE